MRLTVSKQKTLDSLVAYWLRHPNIFGALPNNLAKVVSGTNRVDLVLKLFDVIVAKSYFNSNEELLNSFATKDLTETFPIMRVSTFLERYPKAREVLYPVVHHMFNSDTRAKWDSETRGKHFFSWVRKARNEPGFPRALEIEIRKQAQIQGDLSMAL